MTATGRYQLFGSIRQLIERIVKRVVPQRGALGAFYIQNTDSSHVTRSQTFQGQLHFETIRRHNHPGHRNRAGTVFLSAMVNLGRTVRLVIEIGKLRHIVIVRVLRNGSVHGLGKDQFKAVWPRTRNELIATPVIYKERVYIGNGQDPEHGEGVGHFYAIDATKRGDITQTGRLWHFDKIRRTISTAAIADDLVYVSDFSGYLHCLDANTGQEYWQHDMLAAVWASPFLIDGKVYLGDEDGDVVVMAHSKEKVVLGEMNMGSAVYGTIVPANGTLFLNNRSQLFAISASK